MALETFCPDCSVDKLCDPCGRLDSIDRRWATDARKCKHCDAYVLFRRESGVLVAVDVEGRSHACDPAQKGAKMTEATAAATTEKKAKPKKKKAPPRKTYAEIQEEFKKPPHKSHVDFKTMGGAGIAFVSHGNVTSYLDHIAPGWENDVSLFHAGGRLYCSMTLTIHASDRSVTRSDCGSEADDKSGYGDPSSNAFAQALRRVAMRHGFCRTWWTGDAPTQQGRR